MRSKLLSPIIIAALLSPLSARAETRSIAIVFDRMTATRQGDDLVIDYRVETNSWRWMQSERVQPKLHVALGRLAFDRDLREQDGRVTLSLPSSSASGRVELWTSGGHRGTQIGWMEFGGVAVERAQLKLTFGVSPPPQSPPPVMNPPPASTNWAAEPHVIEACGAAFDGPANEKACVLAVKSSVRDPAALITACEGAMDGDDNELQCVRVVVATAFDPLPAIAACESAMDGDGNELECLRITARMGKDPTQIIAACDSARSGDPDELECLKTAAN